MNLSTRQKVISVFVVVILLAGVCSTGFVAGVLLPKLKEASFLVIPGVDQNQPVDISGSGTPADLERLFSPFWQSWELVHEQFVHQPIDDTALMRGAIQGMLDALGDKESSYIEPEQLEAFNAQLTGEEYEGIGAWVDTTTEYLTIISPMIGSPAEKAGLRTGDIIIAIDGEDMTGLDGELVRQKVLGPAGSKVILTIVRSGIAEPFDVEITRASIKSSNVIGRMLDNDIAYIQLITFGDEKTQKDLETTLKRLLDQKPVGLILDLRSNGGGLVDSAIAVTSQFIGEGLVAIEEYGDSHREELKIKPGGLAIEIPLVVLINQGSASASEIVAGAIQDYGRGKLIGVQSYGKGSVQIWTELVDNQGAVRITIALWLTPNGRTIQDKGLTPDIIVELSEEDITAGRDPQLDKAIEILLNK